MSQAHAQNTDVLIVGGGPAGASAAYWLSQLGHNVVVVEKRTLPREKTCGDGLTPRAVKQLHDMGLEHDLRKFHRYNGLRATAHGRSLELQWPPHPTFPQHGYVVRRRELDAMVAQHAEASGATVLQGCEALTPIIERGFVRGAMIRATNNTPGDDTAENDTEPFAIRASYVIVADGANSRFGRSLGTFRTKGWPFGAATRSYWESPLHNDTWIESALDVKDRNGNALPGYGWIFPVGDGTVNIGVGLLSTFRDFKSVNTTHLLDAFAHQVADRWHIDPASPTQRPARGRIPMGGSIGPQAGPTYLVIGDAAGSVNPFNGDGIDYAYETARLAAQVTHEALVSGDAAALQQYPILFNKEFGQYFAVARLFTRIIGRPLVMRELTRVGIQSRTLMEWMLRIMSNLLRPDEIGPAEAAYKAAVAIVRLAPNS